MDSNAKEVHGNMLYRATWGNKYPLVFLLAVARFLLYVSKLQWTEACLSTASSFYSACGYATREKKGVTKKLLILVGGSGSLFFLFLAVLGKFVCTMFEMLPVWAYFEPGELDVMGSILTKAKCYGFARNCFWAIRAKKGIVTDQTIALSCKWYHEQPQLSKEAKLQLREKVIKLINLHPEWEDEILVRLFEFLDESDREACARARIRQKYAKEAAFF